ncbi:hypothetical protein MPTK1_4g06480 [Marchantia polymorpha subsp. ruderalis]|uniref:Uncharacterized protein n=2 Tax=Marchantia polymorpha TaxID=3197 RepID=A0AAF6B711_MARPO|nr:hypothetical protein MARPO_0114s0006 [Marchantia polymorpha]BBN07795.1 hypothetical protein Mp_4g06480 [Marchantia polymorpha subsp. ruderalis]|eukprot:PTQ31179.1 hypothetical protein MARPO_0114s0006 [Marchantia polymorpha]
MVVVLSSFRCPSPAGCLLSRPQDQADATGLSLISTQLFRHCQLPVPWILFFHVWIFLKTDNLSSKCTLESECGACLTAFAQNHTAIERLNSGNMA